MTILEAKDKLKELLPGRVFLIQETVWQDDRHYYDIFLFPAGYHHEDNPEIILKSGENLEEVLLTILAADERIE